MPALIQKLYSKMLIEQECPSQRRADVAQLRGTDPVMQLGSPAGQKETTDWHSIQFQEASTFNSDLQILCSEETLLLKQCSCSAQNWRSWD